MRYRIRRIRKISFIALTILVLAAGVVWFAAPYLVADPMQELSRHTPVRVWRDCKGIPLWYERTLDGQWRFPVPLEKISPHVISTILATEDSSFYRHSGVNYLSVCRAVCQNIFAMRRISGASTISMQLSGMILPGKRDWKRKFMQAALARKLEMCHSKNEILAEYLNRIPFGGKIYGIEAASRYYFGIPASELNPAEAALLCGLPQKPNFYRPDRYLDRAKERQRVVLKLLVRYGEISGEEAARILHQEPLRFRDFSYPTGFQLFSQPGELKHALKSGRNPATSLDQELHFRVLTLLRRQKQALKDVSDGAALVIDNHSGKVLVYIGTLDFFDPDAGEVDAVRALRSGGSALKPFIYAEAISGGLLVDSTLLADAPLRYGTYAPGNYDGKFYGMVRAGFALSRSLNTPVVRLVAELGESRVTEAFAQIGLNKDALSARKGHGLSLALGSAGYTLWDMCRAYAMLATGGRIFTPQLDSGGGFPATGQPRYSPEVCMMISSMLRELPLGQSTVDAAWKTGTSNNNCDAWCFAYTPDCTVGIWFGNKDGRRSADLIGSRAALPVAGDVMDLLYRNRARPQWPGRNDVFEMREACSASGLTPGRECQTRKQIAMIPGLPLRPCRKCVSGTEKAFKIVSPLPGKYTPAAGKNSVLLKLSAGKGDVFWYINDRLLGKNLTEYDFPAGKRFVLRAVRQMSGPAEVPESAEVIFSVVSAD